METVHSDFGSVSIQLFDGAQQPLSKEVLVRVRNYSASPVICSDYRLGPEINISVPFHDGPGDRYSVVVSAKGYKQAGYFFDANPKVPTKMRLLIIRSDHSYQFPRWEALQNSNAVMASFLMLETEPALASSRYAELQKTNPKALASLFNLVTAMSGIQLNDRPAVSFFKGILWDSTLGQDRFFGFVDPAMIASVKDAASKREFAEETNCRAFHAGATCSWKQISFDVANVQLTFHENTTRLIDGIPCVMIEPDIDDFKNLVRHGFEEVIPNLLTGGKTDPAGVFALRWATAEHGGPPFNPGYTLV